MNIGQKLIIKTAALFLLLLSASFINILVTPVSVSALSEEECISTYGDITGGTATEELIEQMRQDGCEEPDGPCVVNSPIVPGDVGDIVCNDIADDDERLSRQQCITRYHKDPFDPTNTNKKTELINNGCSTSVDGPCTGRPATPIGSVWDCKKEFTQENIFCGRYDNDAQRNACKKGYQDSITACEEFNGRQKAACEAGARANYGDNGRRGGDGHENPGIDACSETAIIDVDCSGDNNPIISLLLIAINVMAALVGLAAVGGFVYGAILYTSAGDKAAQVTKAKETLANVVIGLVAFALMWAFLQFLIPGGVFNRDYTPPASTAPAPPQNDGSGNNNNDNNSGSIRNGVRLSDINLRNLRDAATATNGNILKDGVLYRSSELANLNGPNQPQKLGQLLGRDAIIIDVRPENSPPDKTIPGVRRVKIPIRGWTDQVDVAVTDQDRRTGLGQTLKTMARADGPVLLHCVAGKDRTGWLVAMIMYANGANDAQVMKEYMKSTDSNFLVKREWLNTGLSAARREYDGSITKYMKQGLGLSDNDLRKLRQKFGA